MKMHISTHPNIYRNEADCQKPHAKPYAWQATSKREFAAAVVTGEGCLHCDKRLTRNPNQSERRAWEALKREARYTNGRAIRTGLGMHPIVSGKPKPEIWAY